MVVQFLEDIYIYSVDNFTFIHLYSLIVSIFAIFMATVFFYSTKRKNTEKIEETSLSEYENKKNGLQAKYKMAKQKLLEKKLSIDRSQRLEEEQRFEQKTLQTVMELLQQQSGNETLTMGELQEQLDLYRTQM